ncbi:stage II sporulation protein P [Natronincola ferrireducens]|uniref:Stage II sporulation protein P n=1 Tax=Natronincola ferrireducens TaxID=393762 RepID=A0A1G9BCQ9_9FIRM|nr:stage II sporulation protein P [Natronincola ferrireducens]SDK37277.1 stage II sporulation protein P [Natronincola ferrireducens]
MKKKLKILRNYQNIVILILILAILFFFGKLLLNKNSFAETSQPMQQESIEPPKNVPLQNRILVHAIDQVFPGSGLEDKISLEGLINGLYSSFIYNLFYVDFSNPLTFVQAQFPASLTHNIQVALDSTDEKPAPLGDPTRDIFFVDYEEEKGNTVATGTSPVEESGDTNNDNDEDDLGERSEGIYLIGEDDIVDSLKTSDLSSLNVVKPAGITFEKNKPHILIYHTHGTESYKPASEGNYHTLRKEYSVIAIGEILKRELEKRGYNVIHDTTYHDYPSYSGSYTRSLETARKILQENPSIKVVLDVHRDGYDHIETNPNRERLIANNRVTINNETSSKFQLVIGPATENRKAVETFATYVKAISDAKYPGFSKPILVKPYGRFNQFLADHYALLEVGSNANNIEEAKRAANHLADVLAEALDGIRK